MSKALRHEEPDRVPVSDFFWSDFIDQWRSDLGLGPDADIHDYYDLDWVATTPNMDPHIKQFEILRETEEETVLRAGFEAVVRRTREAPMPEFVSFDTDSIEKLEAFEFDDPWDRRRFFEAGDHQIGGVGDRLTRDLPPWADSVKDRRVNTPVYGSICSANEYLTRLVGPENLLLWIALYPERYGRQVERLDEFALEVLKAQIDAADGMIDGIVIWGDVAYRRGMFFSPAYWRVYYKPGLRALVEECHDHNLPVIYHGCGDVRAIFDDYIEVGIDAYNPLEAKAGLDVVELRRKYGHRMAFCGNMDVRKWAVADCEELKKTVLRKLNAAKGGGYIFQSDHSVPGNVTPQRYEYVLNLVREYGDYPLDLGEYDIPDLS